MLPLAEVQRLIIHGYRFRRVRHYLLRVESAPYARSFLAALAHIVARASKRPEHAAVSCAITLPGLRALGAPSEHLAVFERLAPAYCEGAAARGARHLGDAGRNEAQRWEMPFTADRTHVILSV